MERTFSMLKPGVVARRIVGEILGRLERKGMKIVALKMLVISKEMAREHYAEHAYKPWFGELEAYITSGPVVALALEGDNVIARVRSLCGATKVEDAVAGTIRGDFAMHTGLNIIHASDSKESATRELNLFFRVDEIFSYIDGNQTWI